MENIGAMDNSLSMGFHRLHLHRFGMPVLLELPDLDAHGSLCASLGLSFIELNMNFPLCQMPVLDIRACHRIAAQNQIGFTLHLDEKLDICAFNRLVARAWTDTVLQGIILAKQLTIPIITMHLPDGISITLPEERISLYARYRDTYLFRMQDFRHLCTQAIGEDNIKICVENTGVFADYQTEAVDLLLESPCFGLTYDIGHDYTAHDGCAAFMAARTEYIQHMHVHDATRTHNHLALGTGEIDFTHILQTSRIHANAPVDAPVDAPANAPVNAPVDAPVCRYVIETKTVQALRDSVAYIKANGL